MKEIKYFICVNMIVLGMIVNLQNCKFWNLINNPLPPIPNYMIKQKYQKLDIWNIGKINLNLKSIRKSYCGITNPEKETILLLNSRIKRCGVLLSKKLRADMLSMHVWQRDHKKDSTALHWGRYHFARKGAPLQAEQNNGRTTGQHSSSHQNNIQRSPHRFKNRVEIF